MADYEFLTEDTIPNFLRRHPKAAARVDLERVVSVHKIGDGNAAHWYLSPGNPRF